MLKDLRKKIAKKKNLPPFVVFQDPSLEDMAIQYPITIEELQNITGVGVGKAKRYGSEFVELIKVYVEDKEIVRPQDMVVKTVANKSLLKVFIIQNIDRKMDLEDIASSKDLELDELITEIEAIVNSGTKINIDYYINKVIEEDKIEEIFDYFKDEAETESVEEALKYLGEDEFTEEEVRLVRIKFISEIGN
jgi:ATP-dependent DNA helicase RecQ